MLPNFVIIGAQKSASSFLHLCLREHPDVFMPAGEIPYFESPDYEDNGIEKLTTLFDGRTERRLGIKRPNYLGKEEVPSRLAHDLPDALLIAVLRNPVERAISAYFHQILNGFLPVLDVETGLRKVFLEPQFRERHPRSNEILEFGLYHKHLTQFIEGYTPGESLLILFHEDVSSEPLSNVKRAYRFLGVRDEFVPQALSARPKKSVYNLKRIRFLRWFNRFRYEYEENGTRLRLKHKSLSDKIALKLSQSTDRMLVSNLTENTKPRISSKVRSLIHEYYSDDIGRLEALLNVDLSNWQ